MIRDRDGQKHRDADGLHRRPRVGGRYFFYWRDAAGRFREKSTKTYSYNEARVIRTRFLAELEQFGPLCDRASLTFAKAGELWAKTRALDGYAPRTLELGRERLRPLNAFLGDRKLSEIAANPRLLVAYKEHRLKSVRARTFNLERSILRQILSGAKLWVRVGDEFKAVKERDRRPGHALEPEEGARLLLAASEKGREFIRYVYILGRMTGMRRGEVLGLQLRDIDLKARTISIRRASTKTDAGARIVPLNDRAYEAVLWLRKRAVALGACRAEHYLFPRQVKGGYDPSRGQTSFRTSWRNLCKAAGLKGLRFHDNRHSFRSDLADADVDDGTAMALLGHTSVEASKLYSHLRASARERREARKREAVMAIEQRPHEQAASGDNR